MTRSEETQAVTYPGLGIQQVDKIMSTVSTSVFNKQKIQCLAAVDLSRKGSIDEPIIDLIQTLNNQEQYFTTSSCSGRSIIVDNETDAGVKKRGCKWILTSHEPITSSAVMESLKAVEGSAIFKFEPFVLHAQCRSIQDAKLLLDTGVASGFRNSGISLGGKGKVITAIRSTHSLEVPLSHKGKLLVSEEYIQFLVCLANKKMEENIQRIDRFFINLKASLSADEKPKGKNQEKRKVIKKSMNELCSNSSDNDSHMKVDKDNIDITDDLAECDLFGSDIT